MENTEEAKHEYYKGEIFAMSGTKVPHNIIAGNLFIALANKLKGKNVSLSTVISEYIFHQIPYLHIPTSPSFAVK